MKIYEGKLISKDTRIGIVVARFNEFITSKPIPMNISRISFSTFVSG